MTPKKKILREEVIRFRVSAAFKKHLKEIADSSGYPCLSDFIRDAIVELAQKHKKRISKY